MMVTAGYSTPDYPTTDYPIVLTPGYQDDARKLTWLASSMTRAGLHPVIISPQPSDGTVGIDTLAHQLTAAIEHQLGAEQPFDFFGFSMGGLIGRYYVQRLGGARRVQRFVTVATPHRGTLTAYLVPNRPAMAQMYPDSDFLRDLNQDLSILTQLDFMAFWTPFDLSVTPAHHGYLPSLPSTRVYSPFHATLLYDPIVRREVVKTFLTTPADRVVAAH